MKILQICHKPPFPPVDGGCIAMNNITLGLLNEEIEVKILAINTFKHPINISALPDEYNKKTGIESVFIDTRVKILDAFLNLFSNDSYNVKRFYSEEFEQKIETTLRSQDFDVVHMESLFVMPYLGAIRNNSKAKIVYRAHNLEYEIWEGMAASENFFLKKEYLKFLACRIKKYELDQLNRVDGIAAISDEDAKKISRFVPGIPIEVIPFGINISEYNPSRSPSPGLNLFFLGSMDWRPNREGLDWFLENVWKIVNSKNPELKLLIAGNAMPRELLKLKIPCAEIVGEVADAKNFILENGIMVVPLLSGGGIRVKIIEAMALGKVIIATSVAAKGIDCVHNKNIFLSDTAEEFAGNIQLALSLPESGKFISLQAREFAEKNFDNRIITKNLVSFYRRIMK